MGNIVEIQIRSEEMHLTAEFGAAAHFAYSDAKNHGASYKNLTEGTAFKINEQNGLGKAVGGLAKSSRVRAETVSKTTS